MEHELLQDEPGYNARLMNKGKKDKEKIDPADRKKWNFRKANTMEVAGIKSASPTSGLINPSAEVNSKGIISTTMVFENKISDPEYKIAEGMELKAHSLPNSINLPPPSSQRKRTTSPKTISFDHQSTPNTNRLRIQSSPIRTSPPPINIPHSAKKPPERFHRQTSAPAIGSPVQPSSNMNYLHSHVAETNESFTQTTPLQTDRSIQPSSPWKLVQQPLFTSDHLSNVSQEESHRQRTVEKETPGGEALEENRKMMWQDKNQQELIQDKWTDFSSTTNEVFVPDDRAWAMAENAAVETDENEQQSGGEATNSSRSSFSSESGNNEETEETVWKINEEQKAYYFNQFQILQPVENGVVTGPKARDFFLKSGLATDVLSKIWNLADLDSDGALNFEEFCIAMHIVVAVRHGIDVPGALPQYLIPEHYEKQIPNVSPSQKTETDGTEQLSVPEAPKAWARFSPDPQMATAPEEETTTVHPVPDSGHTPIERTMSDPTSPEGSKSKNNQTPFRKTSVGIPRIRQTKQTNLLDTPHWAILPPPSKFTKDTPDEGGKGSMYVPTGTIIPDDSNGANDPTTKSASLKVEKDDRSPKDSNSSSSETEETENQTERPKSLTKENLESASSGSLSKNSSQSSVGVSQDSVDGSKKNAPLPPPRKKTGHSRSSSLDLQKLFNNKGANTPSLQLTQENESNHSGKDKSVSNSVIQNNTSTNKDPSHASDDSQENFADFSKFENTLTVHSNENLSRHRRSASLDSTHAIWVEPSPPAPTQYAEVKDVSSNRAEISTIPRPAVKDVSSNRAEISTIPRPAVKDVSSNRAEMSTCLPRPVPKKKPSSPPPPLRQKKESQQDSGSDGMVEKEKKLSKEPIHFVVKPLTRLEQLHAKIRDLKTKNTRVSRVNNELQQELKQMMETRIGLESSLEQLKPYAK